MEETSNCFVREIWAISFGWRGGGRVKLGDDLGSGTITKEKGIQISDLPRVASGNKIRSYQCGRHKNDCVIKRSNIVIIAR